ncbi:MAG: hypothetical protein ACFFCW_12020, partial [Candidatus Hodarchaeota archaeon]
MRNEQRLRHQIAELQQQWDLLGEKLSRLERDKILETRTEEKFRLEHMIAEIQAERQQVEQQLDDLEAQLSSKVRNDLDNSVGQNESQGPSLNGDIVTIKSSPELVEALQRRTLALFIGADLTYEVTGLPSRAELAHELARRHGLDESLSLAEVAQRVSQAGNRWEFTDFIRNALDTTDKPLQPFHKRIAELVKTHQIETIITAAYDNLLELAFREVSTGF